MCSCYKIFFSPSSPRKKKLSSAWSNFVGQNCLKQLTFLSKSDPNWLWTRATQSDESLVWSNFPNTFSNHISPMSKLRVCLTLRYQTLVQWILAQMQRKRVCNQSRDNSPLTRIISFRSRFSTSNARLWRLSRRKERGKYSSQIFFFFSCIISWLGIGRMEGEWWCGQEDDNDGASKLQLNFFQTVA